MPAEIEPFLSLGDLSDRPVRYRIKDLLTETGNVLISAYRKAGKSSLILDLLRAMTQESPFLGSLPCEQLDGVAVYVNIELDQAMLRGYCETMGIDIKRNTNILVADYYGRVTDFDIEDEDWRIDFAKYLREVGAAALVVDPIHPVIAMHGGDSNDNDQSRQVMELLGSIRRKARLDHLFVVDHTGHADKTRARGASGKEDWADILWNIEARDGGRCLSAIGRGVCGDVTYEQDNNGLLQQTFKNSGSNGQAGKPSNAGAIKAAMESAHGSMTIGEINAVTGIPQQTITDNLNKMATMGSVERRGKEGRAELWKLVGGGY
jgi:hypothetical protein